MLVSSYNYAAIVLVDSRYLHPTSYRGPTAAAAPVLTPSAPVPGPPSPLLAPPSPATAAAAVELTPPAQSWSTPKRHREEAEEEAGVRGWGGSEEFSAGAGDGARRRRKRPAANRATPIDVSPGGPKEALGAASGATAALPAPLRARDANTGHLRLSPAVVDDGGDMTVFVTPPAPKSGRKYLAGDLGTAGVMSQQWGENGSRGDRASAEPPVQRTMPSATGPVSPPVTLHAPSPAGSPRGSPPPIMVASPPPLKAAGRVSPPPATGGDGAASPPKDSSYCGHYILLVGWSEADGVFIARDPALPSSTPSTATAAGGGDPNAHACIALTPEALDRARRSYGTDEDVLVIDLARSRKGGVPTAPLAAAAAATALAASAASSAAAASAMVGILAMAAAAAAAGAEASGFKEWAWPDRAAWFSGQHATAADVDGTGGRVASGGDEVVGRRGVPLSGAESAARRLASLLSLAASGLRFPTVGDAYRAPGVLRGNGTGGGGDGGGAGSGADAEEKEEQERWAVRMASAMLLEGGRRAAYTMEGLLEGGRRAAYTMEGFLQGGANTMEGLLQGGRRAAYTMEGLLEGGRRAAYNLRDQLADVADAPGGAGAECCSIAVLTSPGSPVSPARMPVVSPA